MLPYDSLVPGNSYLGFMPADEIVAYAGALEKAARAEDAKSVRVLADAYRYAQEIYLQRTVLMREGKDARGVC